MVEGLRFVEAWSFGISPSTPNLNFRDKGSVNLSLSVDVKRGQRYCVHLHLSDRTFDCLSLVLRDQRYLSSFDSYKRGTGNHGPYSPLVSTVSHDSRGVV